MDEALNHYVSGIVHRESRSSRASVQGHDDVGHNRRAANPACRLRVP
jgi:hypothetical protein